MKITFYFVRHGETLFNKKVRVQGVCDSPLTSLGEAQADKAHDALKDVCFDHVWCSPSGRTKQTAQHILQGRNISYTVHPLLHEVDFGNLEGSRFTSHPDEIKYCFEHHDFSSVNGENAQQVEERVDALFDEILEQCEDGDRVLLVSHGYFEMFLIEHLLQCDFSKYEKERESIGKSAIPNAGILCFKYEDGEYTVHNLPVDPEEFHPLQEDKTIHFYYVNHGETWFNRNNRMQGVSDAPLTEKGKEQAKKAADALQYIPFTKIYTSPLNRCISTSQVIAKERNMEPVVLEGLKEINYGEFEGIVRDSWLKEIREHRMKEDDFSDVGGESSVALKERLLDTFRTIVSACKNEENILIVGHSEYYKRILSILFNKDAEEEMMEQRRQGKKPHPHGGIFRFDYVNGEYKIIELMLKAEEFQ